MRALLATLLSFIIASTAFAGDNPASEASVRKLLELTGTEKVVDQMMLQVDSVMQNAIKQATSDARFSPERQAIIDRFSKSFALLMQEELKWERMEPLFVALYTETLSEDEVAAIIAFNQSEVGQSINRKTPLLLQKNLEMRQKMLLAIMPKILEIADDMAKQLQELDRQEAATQAPPSSETPQIP